MKITQILLFTALSGVVGTVLGGIIGVVLGKKSGNMNKVLAFASGIMMGVVCFDIVPSGFEIYLNIQTSLFVGIFLTLLGLITGMLLVKLIGKFVEKKQTNNSNEKNINITGFTIFFAILLHDLPEGMAIGGGSKDVALSFSLALLIGLHNIPEGMSISVPLMMGGMSKAKSVFMSSLGGVSTIIGGLIGFGLSGISESFSAMCMCIAGGAMLYVTFVNLLNEVYNGEKENSGSTAFILCGLLVSVVITYLIEGLL